MAQTIARLIENLQRIENKNQVYVGDIWIAEDFETEDDYGNTIEYSLEEFEEVAEYRSVEKSMGYFYQEVAELLADQREGK